MNEDSLESANINMWKESVKTSTSSFFGGLSDVIHIFILVRFLSQDQVGVFFISYAILYLFSQIPRGVGIAVRKRASEINTDRSKYLWTGFILILPILLGSYITLWFIQPILNTYSSVTLSRTVLIALFFATTGFSTLEFSRFYMAGCGEPGRVEKLRTSIAKTSMPILTVIVLTIQPTVEYALFAVFITYFTTALIIFWLTPHALVQPTTETILNIIKYSKWSVSTSILNDFYHRWDTILLGIMVGSAAVSYYDASLRVAFLATTFAVGVSKTANVKMSGLYELDKDIQSLARKTLEVSTFLIFPLLLISLFNGTYLLKTLFGQTYTNAKLYLILLILVQLFQAYRMQFESIFNSTNNPHSTTKTSLIAVIFNVITAPLLVLKFGGYGVLYSTLLAEVLRLILYEIQLKELFNHYIFPNGILVQYTSVIIIATTLHIIQQFNPSNTLFVPLSILLSTIGFYTIQYTFSTQTQEILSTYRS